MTYPVHSIKELRNQLDRAEFNLSRAEMIDAPAKREREILRYRTQLNRIRVQIAEIESLTNG